MLAELVHHAGQFSLKGTIIINNGLQAIDLMPGGTGCFIDGDLIGRRIRGMLAIEERLALLFERFQRLNIGFRQFLTHRPVQAGQLNQQVITSRQSF